MGNLILIGGTGSLSTAVLNQQELLKASGITKIRVISRDEIKQAELEKNYKGKIPLQCFLGDVRNAERMEFALEKADYVIHTAALKMIERFEKDIPEGYLTNITGTQNVARAAVKNKLKSAIFVSTDKAFNPINAYGVSKLAAMHLWRWFNTFQMQTTFGVCAYGNVWRSRGSVIDLWHKLAFEKKPLPVTDPEMTRFFITKENAAKFVLECLFDNNGALTKVMIPQMKSTSMYRLAELFNQYYESDAGVKIVGLRDLGEKLHEDLGETNSFSAPRFTDEELLELIRTK